MFSSLDNKKDKANPSVLYCTLTLESSITGEFFSGGDVRIDGKVEGPVTCKGRIILGPQGRIVGNISCVNADISGTIKGDITVADELIIRKTASLESKISTKIIVVESGAHFNGVCSMITDSSPSSDK